MMLDDGCMAWPPGLNALVGITGEWSGSGAFSCSPILAGLIVSQMPGTDFDASKPPIDEDPLDVVTEVTNMIIRNVKNGLETITGALAISVPTVIHGRNFEFRDGSGMKGKAVSFTAAKNDFRWGSYWFHPRSKAR